MELRQIKYFTQLYKDCNMTKASQTLFISQQGLSKSIISLEDELGFPLFERSTSGMQPTNSADKLYHFFQKVLGSYHMLNAEVEKLRASHSLKIAAPNGFSMACDRDKFLQYTTPASDAAPVYTEYDNRSLPSCLKDQRADVAFMPAPIPEGLCSLFVVSKEPVYAVVSTKHPLASEKTLCLEHLRNQQLVLLDYFENFHTALLQLADAENIPYHIYKKSSIHEFLPLIYSGATLGFSTKPLFQHVYFPDIVFIPFVREDGSEITIDTHLVTLNNYVLTPQLQEYLENEKNLV